MTTIKIVIYNKYIKTELIKELLVRINTQLFLNKKIKLLSQSVESPRQGFSTLKYDDHRICTNQFDAELPEKELSYG